MICVTLGFAFPTSDEVLVFLARHWHGAWQDPFGYAFWGVVWGVAFMATFLLVRMFFTGWGDKNVTEKTLALSILLHALLAMLSTTVMLTQGDVVPSEQRTPIRRVVQESSSEPAGGSQGSNAGQPRWDAPAQDRGEPQQRLAKTETPDNPFPLRQREEFQTPDFPLVNPSVDTEVETAPRPATEATSIRSRPVEVEPIIERETTASRRRDVDGSPSRFRKSTGQESDGESVGRGDRGETSAQVPVPATVSDTLEVEPERITIRTPSGEMAETSRPQTLPGTASEELSPPARTPEPGSVPGDRKFSRTRRGSRTNAPTEADVSVRSARVDTPMVDSPLEGQATPGIGGEEAAPAVPQLSSIAESRGAAGRGERKLPEAYRLRQIDQRGTLGSLAGATQESEQAVAASLKWLAGQQLSSGAWPAVESVLGEDPEPMRFTENNDPQEESRQRLERSKSGQRAETGLTALVILAYLGAGHTAEDAEYGPTVQRGLNWLVSQQVRATAKDGDAQRRLDGFLGGQSNRFGRMYCHGMATIALGEAYGMNRDPALKEPLERALRYIVRMQYPDGGWRYSDWMNQRNATGDMSLFGWQLMALKSAQTAGVELPNRALDKSLDRARQYLVARRNEMRGREGSRYGGLASYRPGEKPRPAMTAEALFCWQLLEEPVTEPAIVEAVQALRRNPPRLANQDIYYWYYATLAMYHHGGSPWAEWNAAVRETLVSSQRQQGTEAGSWDPRRPWGDYGGRVFSTAMSTLCLEVYYRYLPLYQQSQPATAGPTGPGKAVE
ncbi:MAG: hypothetical protein ACK6D3_14700 [Planctomycetaceae bacterium]